MSYPWTQLTYMGMATPQGKTRIYGELKPIRKNITIPSLIAIQTPFNISSHLDNEDISLLSYKVITHKTMYLTFPSHFKRITSSMCSLWAKQNQVLLLHSIYLTMLLHWIHTASIGLWHALFPNSMSWLCCQEYKLTHLRNTLLTPPNSQTNWKWEEDRAHIFLGNIDKMHHVSSY